MAKLLQLNQIQNESLHEKRDLRTSLKSNVQDQPCQWCGGWSWTTLFNITCLITNVSFCFI
jgi:hypothetical protein